MHNRIVLKKLTVVLKHGLAKAITGHMDMKLFSILELDTLKESTKKHIDAFISKVEVLYNTKVWGGMLLHQPTGIFQWM
jgi:hypothetical protein